eukprot:TRINITY_DN1192_c0_g1_i1.p1 TRINITY_DN1192_c0_g1~~TRINITY_DN1192_c0_g1_i1.p1  ORF type:complete len:516 (+),score=62.52 TRINITY_DN1192_c0_g1_i1:63-1610(+)
MALSRSERSHYWITQQHVTDSGPGSYEVGSSMGSRQVNSSCAPFGSSIVREFEAPTTVTPGPSTYATGVENWNKSTKGAILGTLTPRMPDTHGHTPGPGAYHSTPSPILEPKQTGIVQRKSKKVNWVVTFNPPSIPGHQTNYGYREEDGKWIANKASATEEAEKAGQRFVEGELAPQKPQKPSQKKGMSFARAHRATVCDPPKEVAELPGPGNYQTKDLVGTLSASAACEGPTSSFKSTASRKPWGPTLPSNPGPGYYNQSISKKPEMSLQEYQAFGKCKKPTQSVKAAPPIDIDPGQYIPDISFSTPLSSGAEPVSNTSALKRQPVVLPTMSKAVRFPNIKNDIPGPGTYVNTSDKPMNEMPYSFGGTTPRFQLPAEDQLGPGIYDPTAKVADSSTIRKKDKRNAVFIKPSNGSRRRPVLVPERCSLGLTDWSKSNSHNATSNFSKEARFNYKQPLVTPSPGDYDLTSTAASQTTAIRSFSKEPRFPAIKQRAPDAGNYNISTPFLKRTYNITL